jgi:hypothetical protein
VGEARAAGLAFMNDVVVPALAVVPLLLLTGVWGGGRVRCGCRCGLWVCLYVDVGVSVRGMYSCLYGMGMRYECCEEADRIETTCWSQLRCGISRPWRHVFRSDLVFIHTGK